MSMHATQYKNVVTKIVVYVRELKVRSMVIGKLTIRALFGHFSEVSV